MLLEIYHQNNHHIWFGIRCSQHHSVACLNQPHWSNCSSLDNQRFSPINRSSNQLFSVAVVIIRLHQLVDVCFVEQFGTSCIASDPPMLKISFHIVLVSWKVKHIFKIHEKVDLNRFCSIQNVQHMKTWWNASSLSGEKRMMSVRTYQTYGGLQC